MPKSKADTFERELEIATHLAREAGALTRRFHRGGDLEVERKAGNEPVTIADRQASNLIVTGLTEAFPDDIVISEENADDLRRLEARRVWYIDPIDGTKDFIRGEDGFCVMIGLAIEHRPAVGVVYAPSTRRLFFAAPGRGTWIEPDGQKASRIEVSSIERLERSRLVASKSHRDDTIDRVKNALGVADELNVGSVGLKMALIAAGDRDLYVNPSPKTSSWDTCAPEAILIEAGGRVTDVHGELLRYSDPSVHNERGILASNGLLHHPATRKISPLFA